MSCPPVLTGAAAVDAPTSGRPAKAVQMWESPGTYCRGHGGCGERCVGDDELPGESPLG